MLGPIFSASQTHAQMLFIGIALPLTKSLFTIFMETPVIYALDFDGVICDSAVETGITGWKAASRLWQDMQSELPEPHLIDHFRQARPIIETGYEAILVMRQLHLGTEVQTILNHFETQKNELIEHSGLSIDALKNLFGQIRDQWIQVNPEQWLAMNPLFTGIAEQLKRLEQTSDWYIVTTKQERFANQILAYNEISIPAENIFGLDRNKSKNEILHLLIDRHKDQPVHFVEDRLPALVNVINDQKLNSVQLFFADWGYNTELDKQNATHPRIRRINLEQFVLSENNSEY